MYYSNGKKHYEGNFVNYKIHGEGAEYDENGNKRYEGNFVNGKFYGKGAAYSENGMKHYEGNWKNGKKHGKGIQYSPNGKKLCEGDFVNGNFQGKGILYYLNGKKHYEGNFVNYKAHGEGAEYDKNGKKLYEGNFVNGKFQGIEYYKNGNKKYEGDFVNGKFHGKGTLYAEDGSVYQEGKFIRGQFFDEIGLMAQKYVETRDCSVLDEIAVKEIQKYMETRFKMTVPDTETKAELLEQLILLSRLLEKHTIEDNEHEVKCDEFGNEIVTKCLGNDGNIYDIQSMLYFFQKNERGDYMNISYHYKDGQRRPNFPVMGNGKRLDGYQIISEEEV